MHLDYRFPLFDSILQGSLNPLLKENHTDNDYRLRIEEQIIYPAKDEGLYTLTFIKWEHPKADYYRRLLLSETFGYCNEVLAFLDTETNVKIRVFYCETILNRHLTTCLQRLGEVISANGLSLSQLTQPQHNNTADFLVNCYVMHLLKVCIAKAYLEFQTALLDVVKTPLTEARLYAAYLEETPPIKTFLTKQAVRKTPPPHQEEYAPKQEPMPVAAEPANKGGTMPVPEFLVVKKAAEILKTSEKTIRRRLVSGEIKGNRDTGKWLIDKTAFKVYLNSIGMDKKTE